MFYLAEYSILTGKRSFYLWQPVRVGDVLHLGPHYLPGFVVDGVSVPVGVESQQLRSYAVVFPEPRRVHGGQPQLLVGAVVSG